MTEKITRGAFGRLLRYWRQVRKRSQEDVALEIDSSIRHISFLENGKSLPGREITQRLADYLCLSGRETNFLLAAAGYSPIALDELKPKEASVLNDSLIYTLRGLDPCPTAIIDRIGNVKMLNRGWVAILGARVPSVHRQAQLNILDIFFADDGLRNYMEDWEDTISALLVTLQQEVLMFQDSVAVSTFQRYLAESSIPQDWQVRGANLLTLSGMYSRIFLPDDEPRSYLHVINTVGSERFVPDPVLMIYSIHPQDSIVADAWRERMRDNHYEHPLLPY